MEEGQSAHNEEEEEEDGEDNIEELYDMEHYDSDGEEGKMRWACQSYLL